MSDQGLSESDIAIVLLVWSLIGIPAALAAGLLVERISAQVVLAGVSAWDDRGARSFSSYLNNVAVGMGFAVVQGVAFWRITACPASHPRRLLRLAAPWRNSRRGAAVADGHETPSAPLAATLVFDTQGSYAIIFWAYVAMQGVVFLALLAAPKPRRNTRPEPVDG